MEDRIEDGFMSVFPSFQLQDSECDLLLDGILHVLDQAGLLIQDMDLLQELSRRGAKIEQGSERAWLPQDLLHEVIGEQKDHNESIFCPTRQNPIPSTPSIGVSIAQFFYDLDRVGARSPNREDFLHTLRFQDVYHPQHGASHALLLRDVPPRLETIEAVSLILRHAQHPGFSYVHYGEQVPFLAEIGELWFDDRKRFLNSGIFASTPLRFDRRACGVLKSLVKEGIHPGIGSMVISGASAPITPAGAVVVGAAEILAGWVLLHILEVPPPYHGGIASGSMNMKTGSVSFGSVESMLQDLMVRNLFQKRLGGHVGISGGANYTDAKHPGLQAAYERCMEAHWICMETGTIPPVGSGLLDSGKTLSLEQFLLDDEVCRMHSRIAQGVPVSEETLALEEIFQIGPGLSGNHMETDHTLKHCRESWDPLLLDNISCSIGKNTLGDENILRKAHRMVQEVVARYRPPDLDHTKVQELDRILFHARQTLS